VYDYTTHEEIRKELNICNLFEKIVDYRHKWIQHLSRMNDTCIPRTMYEHDLTGKRNVD
jgi:hypothetical protein